jgi:hypothetical protein
MCTRWLKRAGEKPAYQRCDRDRMPMVRAYLVETLHTSLVMQLTLTKPALPERPLRFGSIAAVPDRRKECAFLEFALPLPSCTAISLA